MGIAAGDEQRDDPEALRVERDKFQEVIRTGNSISLAFSDRPPDERDNFIRAADYADEWFNRGQGDNKVSFRVCRVCRSNNSGGGQRESETLSACWPRYHADPLAAGQKWYCRLCGARCATRFGVLVEFRLGWEARFVRALFPPGVGTRPQVPCTLR